SGPELEPAPEPEDVDGAQPAEEPEQHAPVIHPPDRDLRGGGDDGEDTSENGAAAAEKKRTRRGTRGGRTRKRKTTPVGVGAEGSTDEALADEGSADEAAADEGLPVDVVTVDGPADEQP